MPTEEQTTGSLFVWFAGGVNWNRVGQRLTITNRIVSGLSFKTYRVGTPTGSVTMTVRKVSDGSVILTKSYGSIATVSTDAGGVWISVTFDTPLLVNEEVRILMEWSGTLGDGSNALAFFAATPSVKANEYVTRYYASYTDTTTYDATYKYTYESGNYAAPSATTQATSAIAATTATGNGNVTSLGAPAATQYGHCWATHPIPTTSDSKTTNGVPAATGAYTSSLTGLTQNTLYYCRAYITSLEGTFYGAQVQFTALGDVPVVSTDLSPNVATTTALGKGSIDNEGGSIVTEHGHCWSTSANPTTADSKTTNGEGVLGVFYSGITGLTAGTLYHTRAYATNSSGTGYGADVTFTTDAAGSPIVTTDAMTNTQPTNAIGNGTIMDIGGSIVTEHGHCWSTSVNPTTADSKTTKGAGAVGAFTSVITGLTAGTAYYTRAYATNSYGTAYGANVLFNNVTGELKGTLAVLGEYLAYVSKDGNQRALLGDLF